MIYTVCISLLCAWNKTGLLCVFHWLVPVDMSYNVIFLHIRNCGHVTFCLIFLVLWILYFNIKWVSLLGKWIVNKTVTFSWFRNSVNKKFNWFFYHLCRNYITFYMYCMIVCRAITFYSICNEALNFLHSLHSEQRFIYFTSSEFLHILSEIHLCVFESSYQHNYS